MKPQPCSTLPMCCSPWSTATQICRNVDPKHCTMTAGGELFHHLDLAGAFDEATAMFYAANVLLALEHLHSRGLVYRDLKPENLLLDAQGYCKVADFGFAKKIGADKTYTICGTPDYQVWNLDLPGIVVLVHKAIATID